MSDIPMEMPLLEVKNLVVTFKGKGHHQFRAVDDVSFAIQKGETFGLVGESGSGKTTIGRAIVRINPVSSGEILFQGQRIDGRIGKEADSNVVQKIQMIFQDPMASLNERAKIDYIVSEGLLANRPELKAADRKKIVEQALKEVGLPSEFSSRFPHEFSGGQRQRIGIARALVMEPELIVADEPISALDVSIRAQVLNLLLSIRKAKGLSFLFIAHDLSVVRHISDRVAVIQKGKLVELAETETLYKTPLHPYTKALLSAIPEPDPLTARNKKALVYDPTKHQYENNPPSWVELEKGHWVLANEAELEGYRKELEN